MGLKLLVWSSALIGVPLLLFAALSHKREAIIWPAVVSKPDLDGRFSAPASVAIPVGTSEQDAIAMLKANGINTIPGRDGVASWERMQGFATKVRILVSWTVDVSGRISHIEAEARRSSL